MLTRRDMFVAAVAVVATWGAVTSGQSPASKPLSHSMTFDWTKIEPTPTRYGERRAFFEGQTATLDKLACHVTTLKPGERAHAPHQHPEEEIMIVKEGTLESLQNGETTVVGPGSIIFEASGELHGVKNVGDTPASYYVIKWFSPGMLKGK